MGILPQPSLPNPPQLAIKPRKKNIAQGELKKQRAAKKKKKKGKRKVYQRWTASEATAELRHWREDTKVVNNRGINLTGG